MPFNLLILPLLGGYIFAKKFYLTHYHIERADKERLIFLSSFCGLVSIIIAYFFYIIGTFIPCPSVCVDTLWRRYVPIDYAGISFSSFLLAATIWYPLNLILEFRNREKENGLNFYQFFKGNRGNAVRLTRNKEIRKLINNDEHPLELLLQFSQDNIKALMFTLKSGKVYIGLVTRQTNPAKKTEFIQILPLLSGYRESDSQSLELTVSYLDALEKLEEEIASDELRIALVDALKDAEEKIKEAQAKLGNEVELIQAQEARVALVNVLRKLKEKIAVDEPTKAEELWLDVTDVIEPLETNAEEVDYGEEKWKVWLTRTEYFTLLIPADQIVSVSLFDPKRYEENFLNFYS